MSAPIVQTTYDQLEQAAQQFDAVHERIVQVGTQLTAKVDGLRRGGWLAEGADQFYRSFDQDVQPAVLRLQSAMQQAAQVTREISRILQAAEEEAAGHLRGEPTGESRGEGDAQYRLVAFQTDPNQQRVDALIERFRNRPPVTTEMNPVAAGVVAALPWAGGAAVADGPLPVGEIIGLGILGAAVIGGLIYMATSSNPPASNPNVDGQKVEDVIGESEAASGNVTSGQTLNDDEALEALGQWVGDDMEEIAPGVFRSRQPNPDGTYNQGRIDNNSLEGNHPPNVPHIHLERTRPHPTIPGRWEGVSNNHIPLSP